MQYVKATGGITEAPLTVVAELLQNTDSSEIEDSLVEMGYMPAVHIGTEHEASLEIHINSNPDIRPAAIGFVNLGEYYETYIIETRHAALLFAKEYAQTIKTICDLPFKEADLD